MANRTFYLDINTAREAVKDKDYLDALAFNILLKGSFVSSSFNNATIKRLKSELKIGSTKLTRIIKNGINYGLLRRDGKALIAKKIKHEKAFNILLSFEDRKYSLSEITDIIRSSVLLNHIRMQSYVVDTIDKACDPKTADGHKSAKKRIAKRMATMKTAYRTLSNTRIMEISNVKRYRASRLVKRLLVQGQIKSKQKVEKTNINPKDFTKDFQAWCKANGAKGYMFKKGESIYFKYANIYTYNCNAIRPF